MKFLVGLVGVFLLVGSSSCTGSNPRSCTDGTCTDPALPFCDVDGALSGTTGTCVAVDCTPGSFEICRGDLAVTCNGTGTDYDLIMCPMGCGPTGCNAVTCTPDTFDRCQGSVAVSCNSTGDGYDMIMCPTSCGATGCTGCATNTQCSNPTPVCDGQSQECRMCTSNDECDSTVCEQGACVAESSLVYASPTGVSSGACTRMNPCTLTRAAMIATSGPTGKLRLLPGTFTEALLVAGTTNLTVYGKGATLAGAGRVEVKGGNVDIRELTVQTTTLGRGGFECVPPTNAQPLARLTVSDSKNIGDFVVTNCIAKLDRYTQIGGGTRVDGDGTLEGDRLFFDSSAANGSPSDFVAMAPRVNVRITNSLFINVWLQFNTTDLATMNQVKIAFSTIVQTVTGSGVGPIYCASTAAYAMVGNLENNIIVAPQGFDAVAGTKCSITNNVLFPMSAPRAGNIVADPQFVSQATKDFHLKMTSPAREAAMPTAGLTTDHDFDGVARPQGALLDLGAFEYKP